MCWTAKTLDIQQTQATKKIQKKYNSKALKQAKKMATKLAPIMQDSHVTKPDSAARAFSTDTAQDKYSSLNEFLLKPKPEAQKEECWNKLPHQRWLTESAYKK